MTIVRALVIGRTRNDFGGFGLHGEEGADLMQRMLTTGRLFSAMPVDHDVGGAAPAATRSSATAGTDRVDTRSGRSRASRAANRAARHAALVIPTEPLWFADAQTHEAGVVDMPQPARQLADYLLMPPISLAEAPAGQRNAA